MWLAMFVTYRALYLVLALYRNLLLWEINGNRFNGQKSSDLLFLVITPLTQHSVMKGTAAKSASRVHKKLQQAVFWHYVHLLPHTMWALEPHLPRTNHLQSMIEAETYNCFHVITAFFTLTSA